MESRPEALTTNQKTIKKTKNVFLNKINISIVIVTIILYLVCYYTTAYHWITLIRAMPGTKLHPDVDRDIFGIIESRGFKYEKHFITTTDGYILQLIRLINPYLKNNQSVSKPVLLHHGYFCSATIWLTAANGTLDEHGFFNEFYDFDNKILTNGSQQVGNSLGFVLSANFYDVWLANYRGNIYSSNHTTLTIDDPEFWKFSMDEMIKYDLPAEIDYILAQTNHSTLTYIGHSQGNVMMFGLISLSDEYMKKIDAFIGLSPVTHGLKNTSILRFYYYIRGLLKAYPNLIIFRNPARLLISNICQNIMIKPFCQYLLYLTVGMQKHNMLYERIPAYIDAITMGSSPWNTVQFYGEPLWLRYFDYGEEKNLQLYGQSDAPYYDFSKINSTRIALIYSEVDCLNHMDNVEKLKNELKVKLWDDYLVPDPTYDHNDFLWAKNSGQLVNTRILKLLQSIQ